MLAFPTTGVYNRRMDYATIVENYVNDAWKEGKSTPEIKAELVAKRWPAEMVDAVIDHLIKQKLEASEGKKPAVGGPDLWSQPTWPVENDGWATPNTSGKTVSNVDKIYSNTLNNIIKSEKNKKKRFSAKIASNSSDVANPQPTSPQATIATSSNVNTHQVLPATVTKSSSTSTTIETNVNRSENRISTTQTPPKKTSTVSQTDTSADIATNSQQNPAENTTPETTSQAQSEISSETQEQLPATPKTVLPTNHVTTPSKLVEFIKASHAQEKKLPQKLQESHNARLQDEKIQFRSLIFLGILFFVIILALLWKIFVLQ